MNLFINFEIFTNSFKVHFHYYFMIKAKTDYLSLWNYFFDEDYFELSTDLNNFKNFLNQITLQ